MQTILFLIENSEINQYRFYIKNSKHMIISSKEIFQTNEYDKCLSKKKFFKTIKRKKPFIKFIISERFHYLYIYLCFR